MDKQDQAQASWMCQSEHESECRLPSVSMGKVSSHELYQSSFPSLTPGRDRTAIEFSFTDHGKASRRQEFPQLTRYTTIPRSQNIDKTGMPGKDQRSRAWMTIDDDAPDLDLLSWRQECTSREMLYGIGLSAICSLGAVYLVPGASMGMVVLGQVAERPKSATPFGRVPAFT